MSPKRYNKNNQVVLYRHYLLFFEKAETKHPTNIQTTNSTNHRRISTAKVTTTHKVWIEILIFLTQFKTKTDIHHEYITKKYSRVVIRATYPPPTYLKRPIPIFRRLDTTDVSFKSSKNRSEWVSFLEKRHSPNRSEVSVELSTALQINNILKFEIYVIFKFGNR